MSKKQKPYFVGISGGSGSGKTYLLNHLMAAYDPGEISLISQDNYYKEIEKQVLDENGEVNFDDPDSIYLDRLVMDIEKLSRGEEVNIKEYTFNNPTETAKDITYIPSPIILVEGLFVFYKKEIAKQLDLKVFVEADEHLMLTRRIRRDHEERGYDLDDVLFRYSAHVTPAYKQFIAPFREHCDLIIPNNFKMEKATQVIIDHFDKVIGKKRN